jgi:hypothetical protein
MSNKAGIDGYVKDPSQLIELCRNVILRLGSGVNQAEIKEKGKLLLELSRMIERLEKPKIGRLEPWQVTACSFEKTEEFTKFTAEAFYRCYS